MIRTVEMSGVNMERTPCRSYRATEEGDAFCLASCDSNVINVMVWIGITAEADR